MELKNIKIPETFELFFLPFPRILSDSGSETVLRGGGQTSEPVSGFKGGEHSYLDLSPNY